jgi:phage baseplate assembly protein W
MAVAPAEPSVGIDAVTGAMLVGWKHVEQSLQDIFTTGFGERIIREWYGSFVPALLGRRNITPAEITPTFVAIVTAIEQWEPRYRVSEIRVLEVNREGEFHFYLDGHFRPRATLGDFTIEGRKRINGVVGSGGNVRVETREE